MNDFWNSDAGLHLYARQYHTVITSFISNDDDTPVERDWIQYANKLNPPNNEYLRIVFIFPGAYVTEQSVTSLMKEINKMPFSVKDTGTDSIYQLVRDEYGDVTNRCTLCHGDITKWIGEDAPHGSVVTVLFGTREPQQDPEQVREINVIIRAMAEVMHARLKVVSIRHPATNNNDNRLIIGTIKGGLRVPDDVDMPGGADMPDGVGANMA